MKDEDFILVPNPISLKIGVDGINCVKFHPTSNLLAVGTEEGRIRLYNCDTEDPSVVSRKRWHKSCLSLCFTPTGDRIATGSSQGGFKVHDTETQTSVFSQLKAHEGPILALSAITDHRYVSADGDGVIKIWDVRQSTPAFILSLLGEMDQSEEYPAAEEDGEDSGSKINRSTTQCTNMTSVNDMVLDSDGRFLLVAMDDGTLTTVNVRRKRREMKSEWLAFGAKAVAIVKNGKKVLVGTDEGVISVYNWGEFGNISDRFPVVKGAGRGERTIESIVKVTEDVVCVATDDGFIRAINIMPNRLLDPLGCHKDDLGLDGGDCLSLTVNHSHTILASGCPDSSTVRFWCVDQLAAISEEEAQNLKLSRSKRKKSESLPGRKAMRRDNDNLAGFYSGLMPPVNAEDTKETAGSECEDEDSDMDSDSS